MESRCEHLPHEDPIRLLERRDGPSRYGLGLETRGHRARPGPDVVIDQDLALPTPPQDALGWRKPSIEGDGPKAAGPERRYPLPD